MKLLVLLTVVFVSSSQQQFFSNSYHPRSLNQQLDRNGMRAMKDWYLPWFRFFNSLQNRHWSTHETGVDGSEDDIDENYETVEAPEKYFPEARMKFNRWKQQEKLEERPSNRLFKNHGFNAMLAPQHGFALKTYVYTTVHTTTITTMTNCIPMSLLARDATACARRKRDLHDELDLLNPTPLQKMETTAIAPVLQELQSEHALISSSKDDEVELNESDVIRDKRFFAVGRTTLTSWQFTTTTIARRVNIEILYAGDLCPPKRQAGQENGGQGNGGQGNGGNGQGNGGNGQGNGQADKVCVLACIPPGYSIC